MPKKSRKTTIDTTVDSVISEDELSTALGQFIRPAELTDGEIVEITSPAWIQSSRFGEFRVIQIKRGSELRILRLNKLSLTNLVQGYGNDSKRWVGKKAAVEKTKILNNETVVLHPIKS